MPKCFNSSSSSFILKMFIFPCWARVRHLPIPKHCSFRLQTKQIHFIIYTLTPSLLASIPSPHHFHIYISQHPIIPTLAFQMPQLSQSATPHCIWPHCSLFCNFCSNISLHTALMWFLMYNKTPPPIFSYLSFLKIWYPSKLISLFSILLFPQDCYPYYMLFFLILSLLFYLQRFGHLHKSNLTCHFLGWSQFLVHILFLNSFLFCF